jgi:hypothetical protein
MFYRDQNGNLQSADVAPAGVNAQGMMAPPPPPAAAAGTVMQGPPRPPEQEREAAMPGSGLSRKVGDCTCAAAGHAINQWTAYAGKKFSPANADILKAYEAISGYNPADPSTGGRASRPRPTLAICNRTVPRVLFSKLVRTVIVT